MWLFRLCERQKCLLAVLRSEALLNYMYMCICLVIMWLFRLCECQKRLLAVLRSEALLNYMYMYMCICLWI